jgi:hypothetical protein
MQKWTRASFWLVAYTSTSTFQEEKRFQALAPAGIKMALFWVVPLWRLVKTDWCVRSAYCIHHQCDHHWQMDTTRKDVYFLVNMYNHRTSLSMWKNMFKLVQFGSLYAQFSSTCTLKLMLAVKMNRQWLHGNFRIQFVFNAEVSMFLGYQHGIVEKVPWSVLWHVQLLVRSWQFIL